MTRVILSTPSLAGRTATIIGRIIAPVIEESETCVKYTTIANPRISTAFGARNKVLPRLVATPFPPLKFKKHDIECANSNKPDNYNIFSLKYQNGLQHKEEDNLLEPSKIKVAIPHFAPKVL